MLVTDESDLLQKATSKYTTTCCMAAFTTSLSPLHEYLYLNRLTQIMFSMIFPIQLLHQSKKYESLEKKTLSHQALGKFENLGTPEIKHCTLA